MKKILLTLVLLVGIVAGLFAQKLTYQAVIRDNNQQLVVNTAVKATVTIDFAGDQADYTTTIADVSTNLHGLLTIEFGDGSLVGRDWTGATIAVKVVNSATSSIVYVNDEPRLVSAVPYALSVNGVAIQQYLTEHKYVTEMQVGNQIHDSISNVAKSHTHSNKALLDTYTQTEANLADAVGKKHSHENMAILNATTAPYTDADSTKLDGIESGAQKNVQSDWKQTDGSKDDYIKNKPSITDTVNNILSTGGYVTADALDSRHYLRSDSTVITTMQGHITANATNITSLQGNLSAAISKEKTDSTTLAGRIDALENASMDCNDVKYCIKDTLGAYSTTDVLNGLLQQLEARLTGKIDSLAHVVDSLAKLPHGGGEVADGQPCPGAKTVSDGTNTYNTVKIGNQCWMKENLRTLTGVTVGTDCWHAGDNAGNDETYGLLYNWAAVMKGASSTNYPASGSKVRGICPEGWHVPSDAEWDTLTTYVNGVADYRCGETNNAIANALSAATRWQSPSECCAGYSSETLNKTGFSAVPAGYCFHDSGFDSFGGFAFFWSATQSSSINAWYRNLTSNDSLVGKKNVAKVSGFSVRCLRDAGTGGGGTTPVPVEVSCEQVMECMGDTLGKLNTKIVDLNATVTTQGAEIETLNNTVQSQGEKMDSLAHVVDSLAKLPHGGGEVADGQPCPGAKTVSDGTNTYNTVKIGNQCWMKENLRTTTKRNNVGNIYTGNHTGGYIAETYGYYYDWAAVMQNESSGKVRGICPEGWHVPSDAEWDTLTTYVNSVANYKCNNGADNIANALSSSTEWQEPSKCGAGDNSTTLNKTGFSAVPAGYYYYGYYDDFGSGADFWSATQYVSGLAYSRHLGNSSPLVDRDNYDMRNGFSVRCLRDAGTGGGGTTPVPVEVSCEQVMECMGDTLGKLNTKIENLKNTVDSLAALIPEVMSVTTDSASTVTKNNATLHGNVTGMGEYSEVNAGFKYGTSESTLTSIVAKNDAMTATGQFSCDLVGLTANTKYYFKAFAANGTDTVYGEVKNFTTKDLAVATNDATEVKSTAATLNGELTVLKGYPNANAGFKYGTSESTLTSIVVKDAAMTATDQFSCDITNLTANTQYYFKAFAANGTDTVYGEVKNFTTKDLAVATNDATEVKSTAATLNGKLTELKGYENANAGFKYGTSESTLTSIVVKDDAMTATGLFSCDLVGLTANTKYYFKAFAANGTDTVYGEVKNFTTRLAVATNDASNVTKTTATLNGMLTLLEGYDNAKVWFKYGTSESTLSSIVVKDDAMADTSQFSCDLTGLTTNTKYYFKAFAANGTDTVYGEVKNFRTLSNNPCPNTPTVTDIDNNEYNTVQIGDQCWMAENLRTTKYADSTSIPLGSNSSGSDPYRYNPGNSSDNVSIYGYLYNWKAVMGNSTSSNANPSGVQGVCPTGWHVPSDAEWTQLTDYVSSVTEYRCGKNNNAIAKALADTTGWSSNTSEGCNAGNTGDKANATGFAAVPAGYWLNSSAADSRYAYFWSATQDLNYALCRYLRYYDSVVLRISDRRDTGFSVRCLKD